jgi:pyrroline-5-carboxylate reductase
MKLGFIGLGNMAKAILAGLLHSGMFAPEDVIGSDISESMRLGAEEKYNICSTESNSKVAMESDILVLAVKPQFLEGVLAEISPFVT